MKGQKQEGDGAEDDYMSMVIEEPTGKESLTQRQRRKQKELESKARVPSKAELSAAESARRDAVLSNSTLDPSSKGYQMMERLGFKPGNALGKPLPQNRESPVDERTRRLTEPLNIVIKENRGGIGLDNEKKRKLREEAEQEVKKIKAEQGDYRERVRLEREERRGEGQFYAAQLVAERLDIEAEENGEAPKSSLEQGEDQKGIPQIGEGHNGMQETAAKPASTAKDKQVNRTKPLSETNVLYRGLVRAREENLRTLQSRRELYTSLSTRQSSFSPDINNRLPTYDDPTLDADDNVALGRTPAGNVVDTVVEDNEEEDKDLEAFNALSPQERLSRVVVYLRQRHRYCFWCKSRYESDEMEGCPGVTEEDHD